MTNFNFLSNPVAENEVNRALAAAKTLQNAGGGTSQYCVSRSEGAHTSEQFSRYCVSRSEGAQIKKEQAWYEKEQAERGATLRGCRFNNLGITYVSPRYSLGLTTGWKHVACILMLLMLSVGQMWGAVGDTYTWSFSAGGSDTDLSNKTTVFTANGKTLSYIGGSSCKIPKNSSYLSMGGTSQYDGNGEMTSRYFSLKAPSANGTITVTYYSSNATNAEISIGRKNYVQTIITASASNSCTSSVLSGLTAGTSDIFISFPEKAYMASIMWTETAAPESLNQIYYSEIKSSSDWDAALESGASFTAHSNMNFAGKAGSGWNSYFSNYLVVGSSNGYATATFSPALSLVSNESDKGKIRVYFSATSDDKNLTLELNGNNIGSYNAKRKSRTYVAEYTIPDATTNVETLKMSQSGNSGIVIFAIEVLTHTSASSTWKLRGSWNSWEGEGATMTESAGVASISMELSANSRYEFKFKDPSGNQYGNNGGVIVHSISNWGFGTDGSNVVLYTGPAGDYTFSINTTSHNVSVTYPEVDHPNSYFVYIKKGGSWSDARIYNWEDGSANTMSDWNGSPVLATTTICGTEYWYGAAYWNKLKFRDGGTNESNELSFDKDATGGGGGKYLDETTHASTWSNFALYTITFAGNGNTGGSMSAIEGLCPGDDPVLPANAFTRTGYTFNGWKTNVAITANSAAVEANGAVAAGATINDIATDITLTAQWSCIDFTPGRGGTSDGTYTVGEDGGTLTCSVAAAGSYTYQWKQYTYGQTEGDAVNAVGTGATTASFTPHPTVAGIYYYFCAVTNGCGTTKNCATSGTFTFNAAVTTHTVTYNANGGSCGTSSETAASVTLPTPTWSGYTFEGWYNAGTRIGGAGDSYSPEEDITLYAHWTDNTEGKVFSYIDGLYGDKYKAFDLSGWVTGGESNKDKTYTNGTTDVQFVVTNGAWDDKTSKTASAISSMVKFVGGTTNASIVIPDGKTATVKILYGSYSKDDKKLTVGGTTQNGPKANFDDAHTNAALLSSDMQEITLTDQTGTITLGSSSGNIYIARVSAVITSNATISATKTSPDYVSTDPNNLVLSISTTGASSGWYYRVKNTGTDGYQTPDNVAYNTATWTMTSGMVLGVNNFVVELYDNSDELQASSSTITVTAETAYTMTIVAGANGSVSPSSVNANESGNHIHPEITATPASGYHFVNWTLSNANATLEDANSATTTITNAIGECTITANFAVNAATYTVTYNAQGGSVTPSSETVSTATLPTPTKSGYTFDGWYTSGGSKITGTYNPTADITLYAQWQSTDCDAGGTTTLADINFKDAAWSGKTFSQGNSNDEDVINGVYFWAKSSSYQFSLASNTSNGLTFPANSSSNSYYFCIPITGINSSNKEITVTLKHGYNKNKASFKYYYADGRTSWVDASTGTSKTGTAKDANDADTEVSFTLSSLSNTAGHLMIGQASTSYTKIYGVTVTTPGAAGTCYYVTYNGNGATGGYTTDEAAYASGDNATAATNSFTKTGYTFGGWATSKANADAGTKTYDEGDAIAISGNTTLYAIWQAAGYTLAWNTNGGSALAGDYSSGSFADGVAITAPTDPTLSNYTFNSWNTAGDGTGNAYTGTMPAANTTYYAVWAQTVTLNANTANHGSLAGSATAILGRAGLTSITHATPASGYKLTGYYTEATEGTKVLNSDGTFASSNVTDYITSGKWSRTGVAPTLYAQYEASGSLKWNLGVNTDATSLTTSSKESSFTQIAVANMSNATTEGGVKYSKSKKTNLTGLISTPATEQSGQYVYVTFVVADGYKFTPSSVKVKAQPASTAKSVKLVLSDANINSQEFTTASTLSAGNIHDVIMTGNGTAYTGIVTLKIYCYGATDSYRLGTPIQIDGEVEELCATMPSFTQMNYTTTTFAPSADASGSPITIVGGENIDTYQWKYNTTNDRTSGTECGSNVASLVPLTDAAAATDGTRYYWCEMTNTTCDITIKSPAVAITVRANKSDASVTWTDPAEPNYGGGGYVIRATMNSGYDGVLSAEDLTAPAGIRITNVSIDNEAAQKYIEATFDVTTAFDRDENSKISFTLSHDATTGYEAISDEHEVDYDACSGGEEGSAAIALTSAIHDEGSGNAPRYWFETIGVGRVFGLNYGKATLSTSSDATFSSDGYGYVASSTSQRWVFQPYVEGVTKIRIYIKSATNTLRVLSIGKNASWQDQSSKYSNIAVDTIIYSNDKTTGLDNNQKGYAEIQFSSALTKDNYYMFTMSSSSTYIYGVTLYSGSVGDGGNLATSLTFANTGPIAADASTANFQNIASKSGENSNTLGTITYSSNNDAATVNATTGEVSIHAKETAQAVTITATLSASGCYQGATATYTINVAADLCDEPSGSIELTTGSATKCSDESVTLTMTGFTSGATVEWYNGDTKVNGASGYTIVTSGSTSTLETSNAGTYSAIAKVAEGCLSGAGRTNSITISNISVDASATKIVDKWYVKNGRLTPDIALWSLDVGTHPTVTITRDDEGDVSAIGLTASDFTELDGVVYLSGKEPSANETGADVEYTLTLTVKDACGTDHPLSGQTIKLTHQKNTDKHVLAFVVNGTAKGGFTDGITAAQTTSVGLYNAIAAQFDVQATNIYATDDEKKLKEYYSQYDILCITDYPNTQTKGANSKSYVDAIGALIDIRPILTMEAFVSALPNWKLKGVSGNPKSPTTRQYTMDLQCKDHEIFAGTVLTKVGEGDEAMYRVSMVDNTKEDYATLDATYGATLPHKEKESKSGAGDGEYNYGGKPALQGFTYTQEMSNNDLLPLGLIDDGSGNDLQVGIERQAVMEARLMVLGINSYAMERLTDDGERVVINALNYLMKKNAEDIADCSISFVGGAEGDAKNWHNVANWTGNTLPTKTQKVRILADCELNEPAHVAGVTIVNGGKYNHGNDDANGKLTIMPNGALVVTGKVQEAKAPAYNKPYATSPEHLIINTSETAQAALIFDNEEAKTKAMVNYYSLGRKEGGAYQYQYFAIPFEYLSVSPTFANENHNGTKIYTYVYNAGTGWARRGYYDDLYSFEGLGITTNTTAAYMDYTMTGTLASTATQEVSLSNAGDGYNLVGNSWMAPIQIGALAEDNTDTNITKTAYIYCTGHDGGTGVVGSGDSETPGEWLPIPFEATEFAEWKAAGKLSVIPAMQAFQIHTSAEATLTLDYSKVVRGSNNCLNEKLRAPRRNNSRSASAMSIIRVSDNNTYTDVCLIEGEQFSDAFDNGWEAKQMADEGVMQFYAMNGEDKMAVMATNELEGTPVCFAPGKESNYTISFFGGDGRYYLNDLKEEQSTAIEQGNTYSFTYEQGDMPHRFLISTTPFGIPSVTTGCGNVEAQEKVQKVIYNDHVYIIRGGKIYDVMGKMMK